MKLLHVAALALAASISLPATAQEYPTRPVTLIVPFTAGGSNDIMGRYLADGLAKLWGQPVVVENRPGAGAVLGSAYVSQAEPDGYTMLIGSVTFTMLPAVRDDLPFDPASDLTPVAMLGRVPLVLGVGPRVPAKSMGEFVEFAKTKDLFYAADGIGNVSQFSAELVNQNAGLEMKHVFYKGGSEAMNDLIGGHVDLYFGSMTQMLPQIRSGNMRALAVTSPERSPSLPDVPTLAESGVNKSEIMQWWGIFVPAGTPDEIVTKLNTDINKVMGSDAAKEFLARDGGSQSILSKDEFASLVKTEMAKWEQIAADAGIEAE